MVLGIVVVIMERQDAPGGARRSQEEPESVRRNTKALTKKIREYAQKAQRGCSACAHVANAWDKPIKGFKIYPLAIQMFDPWAE